jgi:hypothetical protein
MRRRAWARRLALGAAAMGVACSTGTVVESAGGAGEGSCVQGSESCPCYPNKTCNGTLQCVSRVCVNLLGIGGATATGGSAAGGSPSGGAGAAPTGGTTTGGTGATGGWEPRCGTTTPGVAIAKGVACTAADTQLCYKTCGPMNVGFKTETCYGGVYVEGDCVFPSEVSYACFRIPTADSVRCPATAPQHNQPCTLPICSLPCGTTACELCGIRTGYLDSAGSAKVGYCVCIAAAAGGGKWACAPVTAWPCPAGEGC